MIQNWKMYVFIIINEETGQASNHYQEVLYYLQLGHREMGFQYHIKMLTNKRLYTTEDM